MSTTRRRPTGLFQTQSDTVQQTIPENVGNGAPASPKTNEKADEHREVFASSSSTRTNTAGRAESTTPLTPEDRMSTMQMEQGGEPDGTKTGAQRSLTSQLRSTLFSNWVNVLLLFAPVGIALHFGNVNVNACVFTVVWYAAAA
jgi:hypothetical protein